MLYYTLLEYAIPMSSLFWMAPLSILFNLSYNTSYIPQEWKLANVVPVHKKDDKNKVTNYRPISLTKVSTLQK